MGDFDERQRHGLKFCAQEGCANHIKDHYWGRVKAKGWFFQKDGRVWCPDHIPAYVEEWRKAKINPQEK